MDFLLRFLKLSFQTKHFKKFISFKLSNSLDTKANLRLNTAFLRSESAPLIYITLCPSNKYPDTDILGIRPSAPIGRVLTRLGTMCWSVGLGAAGNDAGSDRIRKKRCTYKVR